MFGCVVTSQDMVSPKDPTKSFSKAIQSILFPKYIFFNLSFLLFHFENFLLVVSLYGYVYSFALFLFEVTHLFALEQCRWTTIPIQSITILFSMKE